ncbi:MAG: hypothetical protein SNJ71_00210 [Bacteroidales bacterium]
MFFDKYKILGVPASIGSGLIGIMAQIEPFLSFFTLILGFVIGLASLYYYCLGIVIRRDHLRKHNTHETDND